MSSLRLTSSRAACAGVLALSLFGASFACSRRSDDASQAASSKQRSSKTASIQPASGEPRAWVMSGLPVFESVALIRMAEPTRAGASSGAEANSNPASFQFVPWRTPDQVSARIASGQVDFAILPANQPALLASRGVRARVIRVLGSSKNIAFLSHKPADSLQVGLKGSRIVAPFRHGLPALILSDLLESLALRPGKDCELQFVEAPMEALSLLGSRRADAALLAEPLASAAQADSNLNGVTRWDVDDLWRQAHPSLPLAVSVLAAIGPASEDPALLQQVARGFDAALAWLRDNPGPGAELALHHFPQLPPQPLRGALTSVRIEVLPPDQQCKTWMQFLQWVASRDVSMLGGRLPDPSSCVSP